MKLKGSPNYYSKSIVIDDATFKLREWSDEFETEVADVVPREVAAELGLAPGQLADDDAVRRAAMAQDDESRMAANRRMKELPYLICIEGIVSWQGVELEPGKEADVTPENIRRLPNPVILKLSTEIGRMSRMVDSEQSFSPPSSSR